ncbi:MAG: ATP-dependent helicase RecQ family [Chthoniobacteraceae bacterium]|nr:ATP-dependent helicase RecQ family [Chthoniobacteraceae bacterium]
MEHLRRGSIHETLREVFGFEAFREGQREVIEKILGGESALAVFPTGSGKSLCYQLSALHLAGVTLVVSPLIALMKDQIDFLRRHHVPAARLDSSVGVEEYKRINAELEEGSLKLLYVAPERFSNERFIHRLRRLHIGLMVIDEAHCISEWGHNFRPDYLKLARISRSLDIRRVLTLTATATTAVAADICQEFAIAPDAFIHTGFHRPNLTLRVTDASADQQLSLLLRRIAERPRGATIVYVTLQRTAEMVAAALQKKGFAARAYHAGLETEERSATQEWFMKSPDAIVTATIAFGMGIDKSAIRYVYHFNLPKSLENYSQEIGRAGRDGQPSTCEIIACADDITALENFTFGDTPEPAAIGAMIHAILAHPDEFDVSTYELSQKHDVRPLVVNTLLTYLELADVIEATAPFYNEYQFQPARSSTEILAAFEGERLTFLRALFHSAVKARTWFSIDLEKTAAQLECPRERLVKALTYLEEKGDLVLKVTGLRQGYRIKERPADVNVLTRQLCERFELRERNDVGRVQQVVDLVSEPNCMVRNLLGHFGEKLKSNCGHCGVCLGDAPVRLHRSERRDAIEEQRNPVHALLTSNPHGLRSARQVARFLCGLSSPLAVQSKLTKHPLFGVLLDVPFESVLEFAQGLK